MDADKFMEFSRQFICTSDTDGNFKYVNPAFCNKTGYTREELLEKNFSDFIHPDDINHTIKKLDEIRAGIDIISFENRYFHKNGEVIYISWSAHFVPDEKCIYEIGNDITTQKLLTEKFELNEKIYADIFHLMSEYFMLNKLIYNEKGEVIDHFYLTVNPAYEKLVGKPKEDLINKRAKELFSVVDDYWLKVFGKVNKYGEAITYENYSSEMNGYYSINAWKLKENIIAVTFKDITEKKKAEDSLRRSKQLLEASQSIAQVGGWELDITTNNLFWTAETYRIHETTPEEFNPTVDAGVSYFLPASRQAISEALDKAIKLGEGYDLELETYTTKGRHIHVRTTCEVTLLEGKPVKLTGIFQDITYHKLAENELIKAKEKAEQSESYLNNIIDNIGDPLFVKDDHGRIVLTNNSFCDLFGKSKNDIIGNTLTEEVPPDEQEHFLKIDGQVIMSGRESIVEENLTVRGGKTKIISTRKTRYIDNEGNTYLIGTIRDLTERKRIETAQKKLIKQSKLTIKKVEEADQLKSAFLSNMSHEIRTPLNAIIGFSRLLADNQEARDKEMYLDQIQNNSEQLLSLVNDILNISKIESGQIKLKNHPVNLRVFIQNLIDQHKNQILTDHKNEELQLKLNIPQDDNDWIEVDEVRLKEVLNNLIGNALKFTRKGTVEIGYSYNANEIVFFVKDEGIGIAKKDLKKIFGRFSQTSSSSEYGGVGLGLSICNGLLKIMGGRIWVESKIKNGSTFFFTIPKTLAHKKELKQVEQVQFSKTKRKVKKLLIADDSSSVRLYYQTILKKLNIESLITTNGYEAIKQYRKNAKNIDLVFLDIKMPGIDGIETMKRLKAINPELPIIAQTAFAMDDELKKFRDLGFDDCITKPINEDDLLRLATGKNNNS